MTDRIVLVGAGRTSGPIVNRLARSAPLTVIDTSPAALATVGALGTPLPGQSGTLPLAPIRTRLADGTSRLILEDERGAASDAAALIVATGEDRSTLEICRLAAELSYAPIVAIVGDATAAARCEELGAKALIKAQLLGHVVEQALQDRGMAVGPTAGFLRGKILEFRVLPSSPALGVPLAQLHADGWRVAAIYRGTHLVLPTGKTVLEAEDRVLIVGEPQLLPHAAEALRLGRPTFPLLHGPNVVAWSRAGRDAVVNTEGEWLALHTRAARFVPADGGTLPEQARVLGDLEPGVVVARTTRRRWAEALFGRGGQDAALCNALPVPVLFAVGRVPYQRVVFGVAEECADFATAETALDLARVLAVPFVVVHVGPPRHLGAADPAVEKLVETVQQRARLHRATLEVKRLEGNPIATWLTATTLGDLLVLSRFRRGSDSFAAPDVALCVARTGERSVLVCTRERP